MTERGPFEPEGPAEQVETMLCSEPESSEAVITPKPACIISFIWAARFVLISSNMLFTMTIACTNQIASMSVLGSKLSCTLASSRNIAIHFLCTQFRGMHVEMQARFHEVHKL